MRTRQRGMTLIEVAIGLVIFGGFLLILVSLQAEMVRFDQSVQLKMHDHPELQSLLSKVRRDVLESVSYPLTFDGFSQSADTLIVSNVEVDGTVNTIVYDFSQDRVATRHLYRAATLAESWSARRVPQIRVGSFDMPEGVVAVRIKAISEEGVTIIDRVFQPRIHT